MALIRVFYRSSWMYKSWRPNTSLEHGEPDISISGNPLLTTVLVILIGESLISPFL